MADSNYSRHIQTPGMLELTRMAMLRNEKETLWLELLGGDIGTKNWTFADICGGTGAISRWLLRAAPEAKAVVVDSDDRLLEVGHAKAISERVLDRLSFVSADARCIPLDNYCVHTAFIHGALHIITNGHAVITEMCRLATERVVVMSAMMDFVSPLNEAKPTGIEYAIRSLENELIRLKEIISTEPQNMKGQVSWREVPEIMDAAGLKKLRVRGFMITLDLEEMNHNDYIDYRSNECLELEIRAKNYLDKLERGLHDKIETLIGLYRERRDRYIYDHERCIRNFYWEGGPVVAWIGEK